MSNKKPTKNNEKDADFCSTSKKDPNPHNCEIFKFDIELNKKDFSEIEPEIHGRANGKDYLKLKPYQCTVTIHNKLKKKFIELKVHIPCTFNFKRSFVYKSEDKPFFDFEGKCADCDTMIFGECKRYYLNSEIKIINIKTYDTQNIQHSNNKKRRCIGSKKNCCGGRIIIPKTKKS